MTNALLAIIPCSALLLGGIFGYFVGRYQTRLLDKLRTSAGQSKEVIDTKPIPAKPEKPTVITGAYQPPKEVSTTIENNHGAGLVETKTPELLDWEHRNEIESLATKG